MSVMASWNGKTWGVSSERIAALNGVSASVELDTENSDDKAGSPATKTKALKLQSFNFDFDLATAVGCDVRGEFESWVAMVAQYAPFYLAGSRFGPANLQLTAVSLGDTTLDNLGRILKGKISTIVEKTIDIVTAIGSATNVTAYIPADAYATKEDYENYKAIALGAQATANEALALAQQAIEIARQAAQAVVNLSNIVAQNTSKITTLWDAVFGDIVTNPFQITFVDLEGITLVTGVWNASLQRLEC